MAADITIRCFGPARHEAGAETVVVTVDDPSTVGDVIRALATDPTTPSGLVLLLPHCAVAVDDTLVPLAYPLGEVTEMALLPPVAGG